MSFPRNVAKVNIPIVGTAPQERDLLFAQKTASGLILYFTSAAPYGIFSEISSGAIVNEGLPYFVGVIQSVKSAAKASSGPKAGYDVYTLTLCVQGLVHLFHNRINWHLDLTSDQIIPIQQIFEADEPHYDVKAYSQPYAEKIVGEDLYFAFVSTTTADGAITVEAVVTNVLGYAVWHTYNTLNALHYTIPASLNIQPTDPPAAVNLLSRCGLHLRIGRSVTPQERDAGTLEILL